MIARLLKACLFSLLLVAILASCAAPAPVISVESAWAKELPSIPGAGSVFMVIKNTGAAADRLMSAKSDACGKAEVHEMVKKADGTMGMNLLENPLQIPAGGQVELKSGSYHIMCMMMKTDLFKVGNKVNFILTFEKAGDQTVSTEIRAQ